ncbi:alpha-rhamnosidase [Pseudochryseolinea flava]|uniref:alpha-L-rhamnosidase n=2 Tax=Pseudochryseolinea flava TaxID=2059302 RepID=A0A364XW17_9BACT|nr:alpha-rhamnosidase [Pseudochryseolinea flava]
MLKSIFVALFCFINIVAQSQVVALRCEHLERPIGIDNPSPRLSWKLSDARNGARQLAYAIQVSTDSLAVAANNGNVWSSGRIESDDVLIAYNGKKLSAFTRYYWRVTVWNELGKEATSDISHFETAFIHGATWKGTWISDSKGEDEAAAPYFRKTFNVNKKIKTARAYIAVGGLYELYVNGKKVGDELLTPAYTRFDRRTLYLTHDVTNILQQDRNAIGVLLGNGWYNHQPLAVWDFHRAPWRARPTFCLDLRIEYDDGSVETITSGTDWKTSNGGLTFNAIYVGEHYDATQEQPGWNTVSFDDSQWKNASPRQAPSQEIVAQVMHGIKAVEEIKPKTLKKINDTTYLYDLGKNIAGVTSIKLRASSGTVVRLKHGERLNSEGRVDMSNIDIFHKSNNRHTPFQTDIYTARGSGEETFKARFNYKGFQFIEVTSSKPISLTIDDVTGFFMHSAVPVIGKISTSNELINKLWAATNNSYRSNLYGYPTDCPQREKNGWTGDAHIAIETGLFNFDGITVYEKWLADHRDEQQPNGVLPAIIPTGGWGYTWANGPDWTSTIAMIPWNVYRFTGDAKILLDNYENIKRYVDHIDELYPTGLTTWGLGDWVPVHSKAPLELTSSIYYYVDVDILAKAAALFNKQEDQKHYSALSTKIKNAINLKYLNTATGMYGAGLQTELSAPLCWNIVPESLRAKVAANLASRVATDHYHFDVGILGARAILNALSENGYPDVAYKLASQNTYPSFGWWIVNGATTLYENWKIDSKNDISLNHIMFGDIGGWLYRALGGMQPTHEEPGFKKIILTPFFPDELTSFESEHESPYGKIISRWKRTKTSVTWDVTIPANTTAAVTIPSTYKMDRQPGTFTLTSGKHTFLLRKK